MNRNIPQKMKEIKYLATKFDDNMDEKLYKLISMSSICRISDAKQLCDVIGGMLSLYGLMTETVLGDEILKTSLLNEGILLSDYNVRGKSDLLNYIKFIDPDLNKKFFYYLNSENLNNDAAAICIRSASHVFKERFSSFEFPIGLIIAFTGMCLCLTCKNLTKYNHFDWVRQKWKAFLGIVGLNQLFSSYGPSYHLMPKVNICRNVYSFFKHHHSLRRQLYLGIMKLSWKSGLWGNICRAVLRFSKGLEMDHIVFINTYILQDHPKLIYVKELKLEFQKLETVYQEFRKYDISEEQWPYVQIMNKCSKNVWGKENFPMLNYLAVQIGKRSRAELSNFHCKLSPEMRGVVNRIFCDIVESYSFSKIDQDKLRNSNRVDTSLSVNNGKFQELFEVSDILEKSLYRQLGVRNFNASKNFDLIPNHIPTTEIKYFLSNNVDDEMKKIIFLLNVSRIYQGECLNEIIGGILTLFTAVDSDILCNDECKRSLRTMGFELCEISITSVRDLACQFHFENDKLNGSFLKFLELFSSDNSTYSIMIKNNAVVHNLFEKLFLKNLEISHIYVYIGICLLPIFKQLDRMNYVSWFEHKWRTLSNIAFNFSSSP